MGAIVACFAAIESLAWIENGAARFAVLGVIAALCFVALPRLTAVQLPKTAQWIRRIATGALIIEVLLGIVMASLVQLHHAPSAGDQGPNNYHAIRVLTHGVDPYARTTMLDPDEHSHVVNDAIADHCSVWSHDEAGEHVERFWDTLDVRQMAQTFPVIRPEARCDSYRRREHFLAFKYGPAMIAGYTPFVLLFGESGIYLDHVVMLIALFLVLRRMSKEWLRQDTIVAVLPLAFVFLPTIVASNTMYFANGDLEPTLFALLSVLLLARGRDRTAAVCLGISVASKLLPGLLFVPLFSRARKSSWAVLAATTAAFYLPFALWEPRGLFDNIVLYNVVRTPDTTALAMFIPAPLQTALTVLAGAGLLALAARAHLRRWTPDVQLQFLVAAFLAVFATSKIFHTNYMVWLLPVLGLYLARMLDRAAPDSAQEPTAIAA